jgi:hypothetical protein
LLSFRSPFFNLFRHFQALKQLAGEQLALTAQMAPSLLWLSSPGRAVDAGGVNANLLDEPMSAPVATPQKGIVEREPGTLEQLQFARKFRATWTAEFANLLRTRRASPLTDFQSLRWRAIAHPCMTPTSWRQGV